MKIIEGDHWATGFGDKINEQVCDIRWVTIEANHEATDDNETGSLKFMDRFEHIALGVMRFHRLEQRLFDRRFEPAKDMT